MARIRFVLFMLFLSSLGGEGATGGKIFVSSSACRMAGAGCHVSTGFAGG